MPSIRRLHGFGSNHSNRINANPVQIRYQLAQHDSDDSSGSSGRYKIVELPPNSTPTTVDQQQ
jgi:hypothetical protein